MKKFKEMNRAWKATSCVLAAALVCGSMSMMAYGAGREQSVNEPAPASVEQLFDRAVENPMKASDETVYVIAAADGSTEKIIASDWLTKKEGGYEYEMTETEGSLPVTMKISYRLDGREITPQEAAGANGRLTIRFDFENHCVKTAKINGKEEQLHVPFAVLTGMVLDGERVSDVEITNGRLMSDGERIIAAGMALPGLKENLELEARSDESGGDSLAQKLEDMDIPDYIEITASVQDFQLESTYTIVTNELFSEADTEDLFDTAGLEEDMDSLKDAMVQLIDGSEELYDGIATLADKSGELSDGVGRLYDGGTKLSDGAAELYDGGAKLSDGASELRKGAGDLYAGTGDLVNGLSQLRANNDALTGGARQVFDTLLSTAGTQLKAAGVDVGTLTVENYESVLNGVLASLDADAVTSQAYAVAQGEVEKEVRASTDVIRAKVEETVRENVRAQVQPQVQAQVLAAANEKLPDGAKLTNEQYVQLSGLSDEEAKNAVKALCVGNGMDETTAEQMAEAAVGAVRTIQATTQQMTEETTQAQMASPEVQGVIEANTEEQIGMLITQHMQSEEVLSKIEAAVESARTGAGQIAGLKSQLDSYNSFYQGILTYTAGVSQAADGASKLRNGAGQLSDGAGSLESGASELQKGIGTLKDGAGELVDGVSQLKDGTGALIDGVSQLKDGAGELADGLKEFDEEGIQKLTRLLEEDFKELADRVKATLDLSKEYSSLTESVGAQKESVRFIYKTGAIK